MRRRSVRMLPGALVVLAALALAASSLAQVKDEESAQFSVTGKIVAVDVKAGTLTLKEASSASSVYQTNAMTTVMSGNSGISLADLKVGDHVVVNGDQKGGKKLATYIEVVEGP